MRSEEIKKKLLDQCQSYVHRRKERIQQSIHNIQESLTSETKSTAGDKHETGRAMLQLEREKSGKQLAEVQKLEHILRRIDISTVSDHAHLGSLVTTSNGAYFLSVSAGEIIINSSSYFAITVNSPIGKLLMGKTVGGTFNFNGKKIEIQNIS